MSGFGLEKHQARRSFLKEAVKEAVDQALLLRGHRDFERREDYERFLKELVAARNTGRRKRLGEELPRLRRLPERRRESYKRLSLKVDRGSLIHADHNAYSVPSRLMGERVEVRLYVEHVEVWYAQQEAVRFPRLRGRNKHQINYRHIIDWLVRKPGAFENYVYREELFGTGVRAVVARALLDTWEGISKREERRGSALLPDHLAGRGRLVELGRQGLRHPLPQGLFQESAGIAAGSPVETSGLDGGLAGGTNDNLQDSHAAPPFT